MAPLPNLRFGNYRHIYVATSRYYVAPVSKQSFETRATRHIRTLSEYADVAQLAEQLICNQQVIGSSPIIGFLFYLWTFSSVG